MDSVINFDHFLITKFNQKFIKKNELQDKHGDAVNNADWIKDRFELFETFCLPSVMNQTNLNFRWLVFFDTDTPIQYKERIKNYVQQFSFFIPIFSKEDPTVLDPYLIEIKKYLNPHTEWIITTRLDNDDAINVHFIDSVQSYIVNEKSCFVNPLFGVQYNKKFRVLNKVKLQSNPFISRIERVGVNNDFKTVLAIPTHLDAAKIAPIVNLKHTNLWMQVIHDKNLMNDFIIKSIPILSVKKVMHDFQLKTTLSVSFFNIFKLYFLTFKSRVSNKKNRYK